MSHLFVLLGYRPHDGQRVESVTSIEAERGAHGLRVSRYVPTDDIVMPSKVLGYLLSERHKFADSAAGIGFRYTQEGHTPIDCFVYPVPQPSKNHKPASARDILLAEAEKIQRVFRIGRQRGWYDTYAVAYSQSEPITTHGVIVPGQATAITTAKGSAAFVDFHYAYLVRGRVVVIRSTTPAARFKKTDVPAFAQAIVSRVISPRQASH